MTTAQLTWMAMADIMSLWSVDAIAEHDYREDGYSRERYDHLELTGLKVTDIMPFKHVDIKLDSERYDAVRQSMLDHGQTAPIAVNDGHLLNGGHRVAIALELNWPGMWTTDDCEQSSDRTWDAGHKRDSFA